ncbi:C4-dicarboxylate TRAP transporter small permease protein DctQ [Rubrobacter xylanophilus]|uniref:C4-dicarboxylate TRAP transporter small permease protein DctQ n=1 Tax=Rubrobacter xylanophilus TaxID=49319 RepID=A0A510HJQ7_9ACTN|nr:TRAP transporter small permease [Rubrobacter xylanophilus]BBL80240.1 C4-dicarboxylate TRAP transporter small permease protein DctQ [Rubrobacter xylanophilus]
MSSGSGRFFLLRWIGWVSEVSGYISGLLIFASTLIICYAVLLRALGFSTVWQTELTIYLLMFVTFIGGAYGLKHDEHVNVDLLINRLPVRAASLLKLVAALLSLVVIAVVAWRSGMMWLEATEKGWRSGTAWNPPLTYPYAILPIGMALIALQYVVIMVELVRQVITGEEKRVSPEEEERARAERARIQGL